MKHAILNNLRHGLIVSCQAGEGEPLNSPDFLAAMAQSVLSGGAAGLRVNRPENIAAMRARCGPDTPIIGIYKKNYPDCDVYITPTVADALEVAAAGADIVALDATPRPRPGGQRLEEIVCRFREQSGALLMADVAELEDGLAAARAGFDTVATTLSGYTPSTAVKKSAGPDFDLISALHEQLPAHVFLIAEGRLNTPAEAVEAMRRGADAVVVGTAITRPHEITRRFASAIRRYAGAGRDVWAVGADIGGTRTAIALVSADGDTSHLMTFGTPWDRGTREVVRFVKSGILQVINRARRPITAVGIAASGRVDVERGVVFDGVPLAGDYFNYPIVEEVRQMVRKPVVIENDANAAAVAEARIGAGRNARCLVCLTIGTGIGGGIVIEGKLLRGRGHAGELGHICIEAGGRRSPTGQRGCLEQYVSRKLLQQEIEKLYKEGKIKGAHMSAPLDTDRIIALIRENQPCVMDVFFRQMDYLAAGLDTIHNTLDPDLVVIGGELSRLGELLIDSLTQRLTRPMALAVSPLGNAAGLIGAALLALEHVQE
ncbi:MAG: putative N-acetylmannosamine-6-phosphate 2-epimerase [Candidatus Sumerlaeia bacterium]